MGGGMLMYPRDNFKWGHWLSSIKVLCREIMEEPVASERFDWPCLQSTCIASQTLCLCQSRQALHNMHQVVTTARVSFSHVRIKLAHK